MTSKHQEVTIYKGQQFAVAEHGGDVAAVLADVLAPGEQLSLSSFPAIKIPAGGGLAWTLPDGEPAKEIQCVILHRQPVRAFWREAFSGEGNPPDCTSIDNLIGQGDPGGECATCPLNEWGSGSRIGSCDSGRSTNSRVICLHAFAAVGLPSSSSLLPHTLNAQVEQSPPGSPTPIRLSMLAQAGGVPSPVYFPGQ